ncbi:MAG TPA: glycosyltransferase [Chitinophagaceae bacterium]|nr:glycosyltransferase [Chitinophagaceae bacterium]
MISILIPVYNYDPAMLIKELGRQIKEGNHTVEIILMDDGSSEVFKKISRSLTQLPFVTYKEFEHNIGRIAIRQALSRQANFDHLLFLDCDGIIDRKDFLSKYISYLNKADVISGGRKYPPSPPGNCQQHLHWKYGSRREFFDHRIRNKQPYLRFMTNNFLVAKKIFDSIQFPTEEFAGYGHEDTFLGAALAKKNAVVLHIDNPVIHGKIEEAESFIEKSKAAVRTLSMLSLQMSEKDLGDYVKLFRVKKRLEHLKLTDSVAYLAKIFENAIARNLRSCKPSLFLFDLFRLNYYLEFEKSKAIYPNGK